MRGTGPQTPCFRSLQHGFFPGRSCWRCVMNFLLKSASGLVLASLFAIAHASPPTVNAEQMDLDPDIMAKILKEKSRRNSDGNAAGGGIAGSSSKDCGTVNINSNDKKSNSGIKDMFGKQSTTVITGPVINMANCK